MSYAIIGFGSIGQALARSFARKNIDVSVASRRPREALAPLAREIGPTVTARSLTEALDADVVFLAVPFAEHRAVGQARSSWKGKVVVDVTNALGVAVQALDNLPSTAFVAKSFPGAQVVKGFNHLGAKVLGSKPDGEHGRRVVFLSSDEDEAIARIATLAEQLGFAPVSLGKLAEGGALVQAKGNSWAPLIFQDLFKRDAAK